MEARWQPAHKAADAHRPNLGTQAQFIVWSAPVASSICQPASVHRRCLFSSTLSLGGGRARVDSLDLRLSVSVARQAQTTASLPDRRAAFGRAPCSVALAAASARGCGNGGVRDHLLVTLLYHLFTQLAGFTISRRDTRYRYISKARARQNRPVSTSCGEKWGSAQWWVGPDRSASVWLEKRSF